MCTSKNLGLIRNPLLYRLGRFVSIILSGWRGSNVACEYCIACACMPYTQFFASPYIASFFGFWDHLVELWFARWTLYDAI